MSFVRGQEKQALPGCSKLVAPLQAGNPEHNTVKEGKEVEKMMETFRLRFLRDCSRPLKAPSARVMLLSENLSVFSLDVHHD